MVEGIWLGLRQSDEALIGTENGIVKARTIRRLPEMSRWDPEQVKKLLGIPRQSIPGIDSESLPIDTDSVEARVDQHGPDIEGISEDMELNVPKEEEDMRKVYITKTNIRDFGKMPSCPGTTS